MKSFLTFNSIIILCLVALIVYSEQDLIRAFFAIVLWLTLLIGIVLIAGHFAQKSINDIFKD